MGIGMGVVAGSEGAAGGGVGLGCSVICEFAVGGWEGSRDGDGVAVAIELATAMGVDVAEGDSTARGAVVEV